MYIYIYIYANIYIPKLCMSCTKMFIFVSKTNQKQNIYFLMSYNSVSSKPSKTQSEV